MTVTTREYEKTKAEFLHRHPDWNVFTSPMDEYGCWHKDYICEDGHTWTECMRPVHKKVEIEVAKCKVQVEIKLLETEGWSTESGSIFCYEKY